MDKGIIPSEKDKCNWRIMEIVKEKLTDKKMKKSLLPALKVMKKYKMMKTTSLNLGGHL